MIAIDLGILLLPVALLLWALDSCLFLIVLRCVATRARWNTWAARLAGLTDPLTAPVAAWLAAHARRRPRPWWSWLITLGILLTLRSLLAAILLATARPR